MKICEVLDGQVCQDWEIIGKRNWRIVWDFERKIGRSNCREKKWLGLLGLENLYQEGGGWEDGFEKNLEEKMNRFVRLESFFKLSEGI